MLIRRSLNIILVFFALTFIGMSQQRPMYTHYMLNQAALNAGSLGSTNQISATLIGREQWRGGIDGAPVNYTFNVNAPLTFLGLNHGVGLDIVRDEIGFNQTILLKLGYSLKLNVGAGQLGIGFLAGVNNPSLKDPQWETGSGNSFLNGADAFVPEEYLTQMSFDMDLGVFYRTEELYAGISMIGLSSPKFEYRNGLGASELKLVPHYNVMAGYSILLPNPSLELLPSILLQTDTRVHQFEISSLLVYNKKFWGGVSLRSSTRISPLAFIAGLELKNGVRISYGYDVPTGAILKYTGGSHEILVGYSFTLSVEKTPMRYKSIRYL